MCDTILTMVRKGLILVVCAAMATAASASFELALFYDHGTHSIVRYDPVTNQALGSFGTNRLGNYTAPALSIDPSRPGQVAVLNYDGGLRRFNYSTGEYLSGVNLGVMLFANTQLQLQMLPNGNALVTAYFGGGAGAQTRIYNGTTGALITTLSPISGYEALQAGLASDGYYYALNRYGTGTSRAFYLFRYNSAGSYLGYTDMGSGAWDTYFSMRVQGNLLYTIGRTDPYPARGVISGGSVTFGGTGNGSWSGGGGFDNVAFGHYGTVHFTQSAYAGSGSDYVNRWYTIDPVTGNYSPTWVMPYNRQLGSMALVVTPEPGTLIALGAGLAAIAARRRRKVR